MLIKKEADQAELARTPAQIIQYMCRQVLRVGENDNFKLLHRVLKK